MPHLFLSAGSLGVYVRREFMHHLSVALHHGTLGLFEIFCMRAVLMKLLGFLPRGLRLVGFPLLAFS
jgi:hypothetical protein